MPTTQKVCAECGLSRPAAAFRYTMNSRSYSDRCDICRNTSKIKCERCGEKQTLEHYGIKSSGERRRICNACFGHGKTPLSQQITAINELLDCEGIGDKSQPIQQRLAEMIHVKRVAVRVAEILMQERYGRKRKKP